MNAIMWWASFGVFASIVLYLVGEIYALKQENELLRDEFLHLFEEMSE